MITGCSSGLGLALARLLYHCTEYKCVITARSTSLRLIYEAGLKENPNYMIRALDVASPAERESLIDEIRRAWGGVDILINNAGISYRSVIEHMSVLEEAQQMAVNYHGPMELIKLCIPSMRHQGRGKIINISSVSGMLAMPTMASYTASKHALEGASEALWYEMKPLGIDVTLVQPGFIRSKSFAKVYYSEKAQASLRKRSVYNDFYQYMAPFVSRMMNLSLVTPDDIANKILWVIKTERPPLRVAATPDALVFYYLRRFIPRNIFHHFLFYMLPAARRWGRAYSYKRSWNIWDRIKFFWTRLLNKARP